VELEIVSRRIAEKEERKNHKERGCHHDEQRPGQDASANVDRKDSSRRVLSLQRSPALQGCASGSLAVAAQRLLLNRHK
jgi:hypothetical protein